MAYFFARLLAKRPDFPANMTPEERATMGAHSAFLVEQLASGTLVVAGPVMSPVGAFGMAVLECPSLEAAQELLTRDPASAIGSYEVLPMAAAVARPPR
jgi:uncharacterized protein YciI